jgi:hypothetical protein
MKAWGMELGAWSRENVQLALMASEFQSPMRIRNKKQKTRNKKRCLW